MPGNPGGPGNPHAAAVGGWRKALADAITPEDISEVVAKLVTKAKTGQAWAVRELLDRCLGRPQQKMEIETEGKLTWAEYVKGPAGDETGAGDEGGDDDGV